MFFSKNKDAGTKKPQRRSTLGILFNPDIGPTLRPLVESTNMFVNLIAMLFAMNGLFPKDHPVLRGEPTDGGLSLSSVIQTAWNNVSFTKGGLPKAILFCAVTGMLIFSTLLVITLILFMMVGSAHAQSAAGNSTSIFTPPNASQDLAQGWMDFLFKNKPLPNFVDQTGTLITQYSDLQQALIVALSFYSNAILILAAIILFYHLVSMVIETAHHGVPMGKRASQIWAPIRLVVAIGLLVPISSGGLNSGQYIVIQMAEWGSGLASQVWSKFVTAKKYAFVAPPIPDVHKLAEDIVKINACEYIINGVLNGATTSGGMSFPDNQITKQAMANVNPGQEGYAYQSNIVQDKNICGNYIIQTLKAPDSGIGAAVVPAIEKAQQDAFLAAFNQASQDLQPYFTATPPNFIQDGEFPDTYKDVVGDVANVYETTLSNELTSALASIVSNSNQTDTDDTIAKGWIAAGAWFNDVASDQGLIENLVTLLPQTKEPELASVSEKAQQWTGSSSQHYQTALRAYQAFGTWVHRPNNNTSTAAFTSTETNSGNPCDGKNTANGTWAKLAKFKDWADGQIKKGINIVDIFANYVDYVAAGNCVWHSAPNPLTGDNQLLIGIQITDRNPFAELARLGHANLNTAYHLLNNILVADVAGGAMSGFGQALSTSAKGWSGMFAGGALTAAGTATTFAATLMGFIGLIFFTAGFTLAFFLPLIPFIKFFFNALSWVGSVLEAVVMMPLVALAHINPEGDGLPGASAKRAYFFIFNIFLRPVMMVFGLICGMLVFVTAVALMNALYSTAIVGALGGVTDIGGSPHLVVSRLVFSIFYVILIYIAANNSFKLIHFFGDSALHWIGADPHRREDMGDASSLGGLVPGVSGYAGEKIFGQVQNVGQIAQRAGTNIGGGVGGKFKADRLAGEAEGNAASKAATDAARHNALHDTVKSIDGKLGGGTTPSLPKPPT